MYEFDSVSVSSFEAAALAATLTERCADGWEVVAIVPAGSDVVAYLRRAPADTGAVDRAEPEAVAATNGEAPTGETPVVSRSPEFLSADAAGAGDEEPAAATAADTATGTRPDVGETGWGAAEDTTGAPAPSTPWGGTDADDTSGATERPSEAASTSIDSTSWDGSARQNEAPPTTPSVPAGWYADPAGRFELRYWDGTAWTEHVSRGGQQYTDPPVA